MSANNQSKCVLPIVIDYANKMKKWTSNSKDLVKKTMTNLSTEPGKPSDIEREPITQSHSTNRYPERIKPTRNREDLI